MTTPRGDFTSLYIQEKLQFKTDGHCSKVTGPINTIFSFKYLYQVRYGHKCVELQGHYARNNEMNATNYQQR